MATPAQLVEYKASPYFNDNMLVSTDRSILSSKNVEVIPAESSTFGAQTADNVAYNGTLSNKMTFRLSDSRHDLDWRNTWFHWEMIVGGSTAAGATLQALLDRGGVHSLIRTIIVRHGSAEIHRIENYNKLYNIYNLARNSPEYRDMVLADCGDSANDDYDQVEVDYIPVTYNKTTTIYTDATKTISAMAGNALNELKVGDLLLIDAHRRVTLAGNAQGNIESGLAHVQSVSNVCRVASITDANTVVLENSILRNAGGAANAAFAANDAPGVVAAGDVEAGGIKSIYRVKRVQNSTRRSLVRYGANAAALIAAPNSTQRDKIAFQIPFGIFAQEEYFPLPFLNQPLEITLEFVEPHLGLIKPKDVAYAGTEKLGYAITKPRMVARLVEPSADVFEMRKKMWAETGLVYRHMNYRSYQNQLPAGGNQFNLTYQTNIKSLHSALCVMTNQNAANSSSYSQAGVEEYAQSTFNKNNMSYYRFRLGGEAFPDYGNVDVDNVGSAEAWKQLQLVWGDMDSHWSRTSIRPWEWRSATSDKFIMGMRFSKENDVYNSGIDATNNYLEHEINLNAVLGGAQTLHSFLVFDQVLIISQDSTRLYY